MQIVLQCVLQCVLWCVLQGEAGPHGAVNRSLSFPKMFVAFFSSENLSVEGFRSVLQCVAVCCSVLQCVAVSCSELQ